MTEAEWLASEDPTAMLTRLRGEASQRKYRLFAVACCQHISAGITDERSRWAVTIAERFADGLATQRQRREAYRSVQSYADDFAPDECAASAVHRHGFSAACGAADAVSLAVGAAADFYSTASNRLPIIESARVAERKRQVKVLHDIFGNPFRPVALDPAWLTSDVLSLARGIHDERAFDRMPILADALQDAGCDNGEVLNHCRGNGPHSRGCWVVDLVLGKA